MSEEWRERLAEAGEACREALAAPPLACMARHAPVALATLQDCFAALSRVTLRPESTAGLEPYRPGAAEPGTFERWVLVSASLTALPLVPDWPVVPEVKALWAEEALFYARPPQAAMPWFDARTDRFREMAQIATLQRFPAGQFHWQISGFPRSYALRTGLGQWPGMVSCVLRCGGFAPMAETHVNARRKNRLTLTESEGIRSYSLLARSLEQQPQIRGLFTASWLYCPSTAAVTPRLAWLREFFLHHGAFLGSIGPAPEDSGFLVGSEERRKLYDQGTYRPDLVYVVWPRDAMLAWSRTAQPVKEERP